VRPAADRGQPPQSCRASRSLEDASDELPHHVRRICHLQSYRHGRQWSASTIKVIGSGIDDPDFADKLPRLIGDHDVETTSTGTSESGKSTSVSMPQERILAADAIRALTKGTALAFATGMRAAMLGLRPWYLGPRQSHARYCGEPRGTPVIHP
jgi:hypothetical protein